jgi:hypothetical protein
MKATDVVQRAREQLETLTGRPADSVSGLRRDDDEDVWRVTVDVVELERIPHSTDILASYEVTLDSDGDVVGYQRTNRFNRTDAGHRSGQE